MIQSSGRVLAALLVGLTAAWSQTVTVPQAIVAYPDLVVHNAKIVTMDDPGFNQNIGRTVQAIAVRDGKVQALGSNAEILALAGPQTRRIDAKGRTIIPGLINTHSHMHDRAIRYWIRANQDKVEEVQRSFSVTGRDYAELKRGIELVVKEQMARARPGQWAYIELPNGGNAGTGIGVKFLGDRALAREELDQWAPNTPVFLNSHPAWMLNKAAEVSFLNLYGLDWDEETVDKALTMNTTIRRSLVVDRYFAPRIAEMSSVIRGGLQHQAALGLTTFSSHIVGLRIHDAYMKMVRDGTMPIRFGFAHRFCQQVEPEMAGCFMRIGDMEGLGNPYFFNVGVTLGGIDTGPPNICTSMNPAPEFKSREKCILEPGSEYERAIAASLGSYQRYVVNHVYGDKAMDTFMDIVDRAIENTPGITLEYVRERRMTADHCGFYPRQEQLPRLKRLNIVLSCDPMFMDRSYPWLQVYGEDKANRIGPAKSLVSNGIMVTAEAEVDVESGTGPTYFAVQSKFMTRKNSRGEPVAPEEAVDRITLMKMMTTWPSYYLMKEKELGSLEVGKYADFVILNKDYFTIPEDQIPTAFPLATILGGKESVLRKELADEWGVQPVGPQLNFEFATRFTAEGGGE
jgi:predicted amidohydrolase YtcJ